MISKQELIDSSYEFLKEYGRLPHYREDNVIVSKKQSDGEIRMSPYRALGYIERYYESKEIKEIIGRLMKDISTQYKLTNLDILKLTKIKINNTDDDKAKSILSGEFDDISTSNRRLLELFWGYDKYEHLGRFARTCSHCAKCLNSCKEEKYYWHDVISCVKYSKSKAKEPKL